MPNPELLCPAGNPEKLRICLSYGADAVYLGGPGLNLRAQSQGFDDLQKVHGAIQEARAHGAKAYYCLNILATERHLGAARETLYELGKTPPDALIIADPGILEMARDICPTVPVHLSTQANTSNTGAIHFWKANGVRRVNLAREMPLREIKECRRNAKDTELEVFVHGAMCMAISGRCLLSSYLNRRSANRGLCTHACRFEYKPRLFLEEKQRPGRDTWVVEEDEDFSRILAADDLCLVKYLPWLVKNRIDSLKIEGRMKSVAYLAQVTDVYKTALRDLARRTFRPHLYLRELAKTATRPLGSGFFLPRYRRFAGDKPEECRGLLGRIISRRDPDSWEVQVKARWENDLDAQVLLPGLKRPVLAAQDYGLENEQGEAIKTAHPGTHILLRSSHPELRPGILLRR